MKYFALLAVCVIAYVEAMPHVNTGHSSVSRSDDGHGNYAFAYNEDHASGGTFRKEKGGHGHMVGSYGLKDHDGRMRTVHYVADAHGFRAKIDTNEPGVDSKEDPAHVSINGGHGWGHAEPEHNGGKYYGGHGYAMAEGNGWGYGGHGHGHGFDSSYGVKIAHSSYAEPEKYVSHGYHGKW